MAPWRNSAVSFFASPWMFLLKLIGARGCFLDIAEVRLANGTNRPIGDIQLGDRVLSWDEVSQRSATATVIAKEVAEATDFVKVSFIAADSGCQTALAMATDHPVWSVRLQRLVSMEPVQTRLAYGLEVSKIARNEALHHHSGTRISALVERVSATAYVNVTTLHLHRHHWFFLNGIRVHNKAKSSSFHSRTGSGSSSAPPPATQTHTRADYESNASYAAVILQYTGTRRRYGTFFNNETSSACSMESDDVVSGHCKDIVANLTLCYACMECEAIESCAKPISACVDFLSASFSSCNSVVEELGTDIEFLMILVLVFCCVVGSVATFCSVRYLVRLLRLARLTKELDSMKNRRRELEPLNERRLLRLSSEGFRTKNPGVDQENGVLVSHDWRIQRDGCFNGTVTCLDAKAPVAGKLRLGETALAQEIACVMWEEKWFDFRVEVDARIKECNGGYVLVAQYVSPHRKGWINLVSSSYESSGHELDKPRKMLSVIEENSRQSQSSSIVQRQKSASVCLGVEKLCTKCGLSAPEVEGSIVGIPYTPQVGGGLEESYYDCLEDGHRLDYLSDVSEDVSDFSTSSSDRRIHL